MHMKRPSLGFCYMGNKLPFGKMMKLTFSSYFILLILIISHSCFAANDGKVKSSSSYRGYATCVDNIPSQDPQIESDALQVWIRWTLYFMMVVSEVPYQLMLMNTYLDRRFECVMRAQSISAFNFIALIFSFFSVVFINIHSFLKALSLHVNQLTTVYCCLSINVALLLSYATLLWFDQIGNEAFYGITVAITTVLAIIHGLTYAATNIIFTSIYPGVAALDSWTGVDTKAKSQAVLIATTIYSAASNLIPGYTNSTVASGQGSSTFPSMTLTGVTFGVYATAALLNVIVITMLAMLQRHSATFRGDISRIDQVVSDTSNPGQSTAKGSSGDELLFTISSSLLAPTEKKCSKHSTGSFIQNVKTFYASLLTKEKTQIYSIGVFVLCVFQCALYPSFIKQVYPCSLFDGDPQGPNKFRSILFLLNNAGIFIGSHIPHWFSQFKLESTVGVFISVVALCLTYPILFKSNIRSITVASCSSFASQAGYIDCSTVILRDVALMCILPIQGLFFGYLQSSIVDNLDRATLDSLYSRMTSLAASFTGQLAAIILLASIL